MRPLRILTWHVHGNYLYYLSLGGHALYLPVRPGRPPGYAGRAGSFPWPETVHEVPAETVRDLPLDLILYQSAPHWLEDQHDLLSDAQRELPKVYIEHDPPREHPTDTRHWVDDPGVLLVHVTPFNELMWDSGRTPTRVIDHGVPEPDARYSGELERGLAVVNNLALRGRRLGRDVYERVSSEVPVDLVGMGAEQLGGLGEVPMPELPAFSARYRFFFNPIRYTSMGLAACEAMMLGMPIVGLATTEMAVAVENGVSGYVETDVRRLVSHMRRLLADPLEARRLGDGARRYALERFGLERFLDGWDEVFAAVTGVPATEERRAVGGRAVAEGRP